MARPPGGHRPLHPHWLVVTSTGVSLLECGCGSPVQWDGDEWVCQDDGHWARRQYSGRVEDPTRCAAVVRETRAVLRQCYRTRTHGPQREWCWQHLRMLFADRFGGEPGRCRLGWCGWRNPCQYCAQCWRHCLCPETAKRRSANGLASPTGWD